MAERVRERRITVTEYVDTNKRTVERIEVFEDWAAVERYVARRREEREGDWT